MDGQRRSTIGPLVGVRASWRLYTRAKVSLPPFTRWDEDEDEDDDADADADADALAQSAVRPGMTRTTPPGVRPTSSPGRRSRPPVLGRCSSEGGETEQMNFAS